MVEYCLALLFLARDMNEQQGKYAVWKNPAQLLLYLTLAAGALLRVAVWWQNRSLFIDEANLARNFCERSLLELLQPLSYQQYAPPGFLWVQEMITTFLGFDERAIRVFPLFCGLAGIYLFYWISRRLMPNAWVRLAAIWIFCFSDFLLRYATEGKQYSSDLAIALGLIALSLASTNRPFRAVWAATIGAVTIWFSMPAVFVLFGAGLFFLQKYWAEKDRRSLAKVVGAISVWLLSFAAYYWLLLHPILAIQPLVEHHQNWFFPLIPSSQADWLQARDLLLSFPYYSAGFTVLALFAGSAGILTGLIWVIRQRKDLALLLAVPVFVCLVVSGLGLYSLIPRMLVWAIPLVVLLQILGWQQWWTAGKRWYWRILCALLIVPTAGLQRGWQYLAKPFHIEEIRPVLDAVAPNFQPGDLLYVSHEALPAVAYYRECHPNLAQYQFDDRVFYGNWDIQPTLENISRAEGKHRRIWFVYSHVISDHTRQQIQADLALIGQYASQKNVVEMVGARGYLYELK